MKKLMVSFAASAAIAAAIGDGRPAVAADAPAAATEDKAAGVAIGDPAPAWKDLVGVDDAQHNLSDLANAKAVIVAFTCNHCPVAQAYEDRLIELAADYADKGVELVAINVNNMEPDKLPAMKERAEEKGFKFDYLYDPTQQIGRDFGAIKTPHVFLLDGDRNVVYMGAIDDNMSADKATKHYLRDAIDAVLAGQKPATASTDAMGCGIKYE